MTYWQELRSQWRPLLAAFLGLGSGFSLAGTVTSAIAPSLIADNHWSNAEFAAIGSLGLFAVFAYPIAGRIADVAGVRLTALIGQVSLPLIYLAYSVMGGAISTFIAIFLVQSILCVTTTATVYTRLPVRYVQRARGTALAIVASGPAVTGAILGPLLNSYVEAHGWRASYHALALFTAAMGLIVFLLIPSDRGKAGAERPPKRQARTDYPLIFRTPAFWILAFSMLLCSLPRSSC